MLFYSMKIKKSNIPKYFLKKLTQKLKAFNFFMPNIVQYLKTSLHFGLSCLSTAFYLYEIL